jgi:cell division inhibitor SulA
MTKNPHAVALGRLGGAKGGRARARALTAGRRREIARQASAARTRSLSAEERRELASRAARARWSITTPTAPTVRSWLRDLGAPLTRAAVANRRAPAPEQVVVQGLRLAHTDASVARALPVMLWANRDTLRLADLVRRARRAKEGSTLGFFLELTSELAESRRPFAAEYADLRRDRPPSNTFFFEGAEKSLVGKELAAINTPPVARRWRFLMNMPLDSFETLFRKTFGAPPSSGT